MLHPCMTSQLNVNLHTAPADAGDGTILSNLLMFGEVLRRLGLDVGSGNMLDLVRATEFVPIGGNRNDFRLAARALLVHRRSDLELFDEGVPGVLEAAGPRAKHERPALDGRGAPLPHAAGDAAPGGYVRRNRRAVTIPMTPATGNRWWTCSGLSARREVLRQRDFAEYTSAEVAAARALMSELQWDLGSRRTPTTYLG